MRAIDTNVLIRLLTRDDLRQAASAENFITKGAWVTILPLWQKTTHRRENAMDTDNIKNQNPTGPALQPAITAIQKSFSRGFLSVLRDAEDAEKIRISRTVIQRQSAA